MISGQHMADPTGTIYTYLFRNTICLSFVNEELQPKKYKYMARINNIKGSRLNYYWFDGYIHFYVPTI